MLFYKNTKFQVSRSNNQFLIDIFLILVTLKKKNLKKQ
jgi:hypothetical protein